jgi:hypothetical protein
VVPLPLHLLDAGGAMLLACTVTSVLTCAVPSPAAIVGLQVTVNVFYLNPRRFVDGVLYRLHMIGQNLRSQERKVSDKAAFECPKCMRKVRARVSFGFVCVGMGGRVRT